MGTDFDSPQIASIVKYNGDLTIKDSSGHIIYSHDLDGFEQWYKYDENNNCIYYKNSDQYSEWREYDDRRNCIHHENSDQYSDWCKYDAHGILSYLINSNGYEVWYNNGDEITKEQFDSLNQS